MTDLDALYGTRRVGALRRGAPPVVLSPQLLGCPVTARPALFLDSVRAVELSEPDTAVPTSRPSGSLTIAN